MTIVDSSVLLNAVNTAAVAHGRARTWLDAALSGTETVGFAWVTILGFLRVSTHPRVFAKPLTVVEARAHLNEWLARPAATIVQPGIDHLSTVADLLGDVGTAGELTSDAHLAALAIEQEAEVVTFDRDFGRFERVRWRTP